MLRKPFLHSYLLKVQKYHAHFQIIRFSMPSTFILKHCIMGTAILSDWLGSSEVTIQTTRFLTTFLQCRTPLATSGRVTSHSNAERLKQVSHKISVVPKPPIVPSSMHQMAREFSNYLIFNKVLRILNSIIFLISLID